MSWWGTLAGGAFGFMMAGPLGAVLGAAVGRKFDQGLKKNLQAGGQTDSLPRGHQFRVQAAFFTATFSVIGHISKADGRVTDHEIRLARRVMEDMNLSSEQRETARSLFTQGKTDHFDLSAVLAQFRQEVGRRSTLQRMFIEILCFVVYADGVVHPGESRVLRQVCDEIGFPRHEMESIMSSVSAELHHRDQAGDRISLDDAYSVLNVEASASDAEVKKSYRRLVGQHHPDKLVAKGLPEEMMKIATRRTREIRQAYECIKKHRGL